MKISVTSNAFSKNETLLNELIKEFPNVEISTTTKRYSESELIDSLKDSELAIVGLDKINERVLNNCHKLEVISKYGVGLDNIDLEACKKYGVEVLYEKGVNKRSVAELTLGMMLNLTRNIQLTSNQLKNEKWNKSGGYDLSGKTIGIIGAGNIGKELVELLSPFHCQILVNDIIEQSDYYREKNLQERSKGYIFRKSDIVTLHVPLTNETRNLVNKYTLSLMKPTSYLINTSRGEVVNTGDLYYALKDEDIAGAGLDVYTEEPPKNRKLIELENLICTPHIAGNSEEAVLSMGRSSIRLLKNYFSSKNE